VAPNKRLPRYARCAGGRCPAMVFRHEPAAEERPLQTRAMRRRACPAWACRHVRAVDDTASPDARDAPESVAQREPKTGRTADVEAVHDLGPNAVESSGGNARVPRLSPRGLADTHVSSKSGFSRRARCTGERGPAWASRHARYRKTAAQTRVTRRNAWHSGSQRRKEPADAKAVRDLGP